MDPLAVVMIFGISKEKTPFHLGGDLFEGEVVFEGHDEARLDGIGELRGSNGGNVDRIYLVLRRMVGIVYAFDQRGASGFRVKNPNDSFADFKSR